MITSIEQSVGHTVICYEINRFDSIYAPTFIAEVKERIFSEEKAIILDLSLVEFMDSSGVGAIVSLFKSLHAKATLLLCGASENVENLLELTGVNRLFPVYPNEKAARLALED